MRLIDIVYHSTPGLRVITKKKKTTPFAERNIPTRKGCGPETLDNVSKSIRGTHIEPPRSYNTTSALEKLKTWVLYQNLHRKVQRF